MNRIGLILPFPLIVIAFSGMALFAAQNATSDDPLAEIETLIRREMFDEAEAALASLSPKTPSETIRKAELTSQILSKRDRFADAAESYRRLADACPDSARFRVACWRFLSLAAGKDTTLQTAAAQAILREGERYAEGSSQRDCYLAYMAAALTGDSTAEAKGDRLCELYPTSDEATDLIGGRFWDGLYPIWENDSAKVPYFREFIAKYRANSWANYGCRSLSLTLLALKDTLGAVQAASDWIARAPNHPNMLSGAAGYLLDIPQGKDSAVVWIERAYEQRAKVVRPPHVTVEEWLLYEKQTKASIPLLMAELRIRAGKFEEAKRFAEESLKEADYDIDDNNTPAPQYLMLGRIALAMKDTAKAADDWIKAAVEGDVYNRFAGRAVDSLKALWGLNTGNTGDRVGAERRLLEYCRKVTGYKGITFDRVTAEAGLDSARGGRVAWGDYDGDGDDDLLAGGSRLYANVNANANGGFREVTEQVKLEAPACHGGIWGDIDNDGDLDLFCFSSSGDRNNAEKLFVNEGSGRLVASPLSPSLADSFSNESAIWFDANGDGLLDLYIPGYEKPAKGADDLGNAWPSRLMVQGADGVFRDSTEAYGIGKINGRWLCGRSPVACDFDRDGDQDLYVGNYRLQENQFWVNGKWKMEYGTIGDGKFENRAALYGVDGEEVEGWWGHTIGCEWGDFDGDGDFDLIACNLAHPRYIGFSNRTMLYRNDEDDTITPKSKIQNPKFTNVQREWRIKYEECHSEPCWGDFDNDGDLDLFITCVYPNRRSFLYENMGDHFEDVTFLSGTRIFNGWGCATADYDNDGKLDLAACEGGKIELFRNNTLNDNNWIEIAPDRRPGVQLTQIGGIVEIETNLGRKIIRQFEGGKGAGSQNSGTLHFGIGKATKCKMTVSNYGKSEYFKGLRANQRFEIGKETVGIQVR